MFQPLFASWINQYPTILWLRLFGELLISLSESMIAPFLVLYLHEKLGGHVILIMLVIGLQPLTEIFISIVGGGVTDRFGRKPVMLAALTLQAVAMTGLAFAGSLAVFACMYVINGAARSLFIPAARAQLVDSIGERQRAEAFALLSSAGYVGTSVGPLLGVMMYQHNPSVAFLCVALSFGLYALMIWRKLPETAPLRSPEENVEADRTTRLSIMHILGQYQSVLTLMLLALPISLFYSQTETNLQLHLKNSFTDYVSVIAWMAAAKGVLAISLQFWLVKRTQHLPANRLVVFSYLSFAAVSAGYAVSDSVPLLLALQLILVIGESIGLTQLLTIVSLQAPAAMRGRYFSIFGTHWDISRTVGPFLGSLVLLQFGGDVLFTLTALILLVGAYTQHRFLRTMQKASPAVREG